MVWCGVVWFGVVWYHGRCMWWFGEDGRLGWCSGEMGG